MDFRPVSYLSHPADLASISVYYTLPGPLLQVLQTLDQGTHDHQRVIKERFRNLAQRHSHHPDTMWLPDLGKPIEGTSPILLASLLDYIAVYFLISAIREN